ncbi:UDP-N-acetylglucosamine 1-carboxyvinyltransferase [Candidatus Saccharibacteria bacterium]|nr:UDP-N-acetylglucosamine 1-carboxyvinyltransferase [Candidatus Saccharibacteria bacterium]
MQEYQQKIGELISRIRSQKGLTQKDLAVKLGTSQSAINRIEAGKQNVTLEMLARISDVLNKELVSLSNNSVSLKVDGGHTLSGSIDVKVSKNATVGLLCAALLNRGTTTLKKVPKIEEVYRLIEVLVSIGVKVTWHDNGNVEIKPPKELELSKMNVKAAKRTRSVIMYLGALMHRYNSFRLPYAGGCKLGKRTVSPHLYALEEFGVSVETKNNYYQATIIKKLPGEVTLYEMGETVSENTLMAAALTVGTTTIRNISSNYMVQDMCFFLEACGVRIDGIGSNTLVVHGVKDIDMDITYAPSEDPIEAMSFLSAAITTNSQITIRRCSIDFLRVELLRLQKMGCEFTLSKPYLADNNATTLVDITTHTYSSLRAPEDKVHAAMHPGINMDNLLFFAPIVARAKGTTLIHDWSYEDRAIYLTELRKLGVDVKLADPHRVYITGPSKFEAADIISPAALRPAVIILITMLAAPGTSILRNIYSIARGYEDFAERLNSLGANITVVRDI